MKNVFVIAALLLSSGIAQATSLAKPVASVKVQGGFCAGPCPTTTITIYEIGTVAVETQNFKPETFEALPVESITLANLGDGIGTELDSKIQLIKEARLVDLDRKSPVCADASDVTYTIFKDGFKGSVIAKDTRCHRLRLPNNEGTFLIKTLEGLLALHNLTRK